MTWRTRLGKEKGRTQHVPWEMNHSTSIEAGGDGLIYFSLMIDHCAHVIFIFGKILYSCNLLVNKLPSGQSVITTGN